MFRQVDVLGPFFDKPGEEFHLRQLSRMLKTSPPTVKSKLENPVKAGILAKKNIRNAVVYSPNLDSLDFKRRLSEYNILKLRGSGLLDFIGQKLTLPCVVLFGSWGKGENRTGSDIDLFIMTEDRMKLDLSQFEKKLGAEIQLFVHSKKEVDDMKKSSPELLNNIINGKILTGFLEVF